MHHQVVGVALVGQPGLLGGVVEGHLDGRPGLLGQPGRVDEGGDLVLHPLRPTGRRARRAERLHLGVERAGLRGELAGLVALGADHRGEVGEPPAAQVEAVALLRADREQAAAEQHDHRRRHPPRRRRRPGDDVGRRRHADYANPPSGAVPPVTGAANAPRRLTDQPQEQQCRSPRTITSEEKTTLFSVRFVIALLLIVAGIALARLLLHRRPAATRSPSRRSRARPRRSPTSADWNYAIGFGLLMLGLMVSAHPSTPLGRGRGVVVGMLACFLIGLLWICTFYVFSDDLSKLLGLQRPRPVEPRRRHRVHGGRVQLRDQVGVGSPSAR